MNHRDFWYYLCQFFNKITFLKNSKQTIFPLHQISPTIPESEKIPPNFPCPDSIPWITNTSTQLFNKFNRTFYIKHVPTDITRNSLPNRHESSTFHANEKTVFFLSHRITCSRERVNDKSVLWAVNFHVNHEMIGDWHLYYHYEGDKN